MNIPHKIKRTNFKDLIKKKVRRDLVIVDSRKGGRGDRNEEDQGKQGGKRRSSVYVKIIKVPELYEGLRNLVYHKRNILTSFKKF